MYIRFETDLKFSNRNCPKGIFAAMGDCQRSGKMTLRGHIWYRTIAAWFNSNLDFPTCFLHPILPAVKFKALSWFSLNFNQYLAKALLVVQFLRFNGFAVKTYIAPDPGSPVYKSKNQVVVLPYA